MKRILKLLAILLALVSILAIAGCDKQEQENNQTEGEVNTESNVFDPEAPYLLMATDIQNGRVIVFNLDEENPMDPDSYYWVWEADPALGWKHTNKLNRGLLADARLRWSELHQSYVVLLASAGGWVGIAEYPSGKCLWETLVDESGPHAIELLPNGDLVVACSGSTRWETDGCMLYYDTSDGKNWAVTSKDMLPSAHGVLWDPENNVVWATGYYDIVAYDILTDDGGKPILSKRTDGMGSMLVSASGHDLMPDYSDPDKIWITTERSIQKYSKSADKVLNEYSYSDMILGKYRVKGVTSFAGGAVAYSQCGATSNDWLDTFYVLWPLDLEGKEAVEVEYTSEDGAYWNKVRNFNPNYL